MEVWREGDYHGKVFAFPKMDLHIDSKSFEDPEQKKLLKYACEIASENGSPYFIFDREDISLAACCRLKNRDNRSGNDTASGKVKICRNTECYYQSTSIRL